MKLTTPYGEELIFTKNDNYTVIEVIDDNGNVCGVPIETKELIKFLKKVVTEL